MSNFVGLNTALTGLRASQYGLDTASHNVANANTKGYTRQRVDLKPANPYLSPVGPMGSGVTISGIGRLRDGFLDARFRTTLGEFTRLDTRAQLLGRTESVFGEPEHGISSALGDLWNTFEDLALDPAHAGPRRQVIGSLETLTSRIRSVAVGWAELERDTTQRLETDLAEANDLLERVAELNVMIPKQAGTNGALPSDLLDERDNLLDRLAELVGASARPGGEGQMIVTIGGHDLPAIGAPPALEFSGGALRLDDGSAPEPWAVGGQIGATAQFLTVDLVDATGKLDAFAEHLLTTLNTEHGKGTDQNGDPGGPLLAFIGGAGARNLHVDPQIAGDPRLLAAALSDAPHDGGNAMKLAYLRDAMGPGGKTLAQDYESLLVGVATGVATTRRAADGQHALAVSAENARHSMHGVSIDEEMADVVKFQRSLEAMSRVMTAIDQALDVLINRTGLVGR